MEKTGSAPCHHFLAGSCTYGSRCKFMHPANESEMSRAKYEEICTRVTNLKPEDYGKWWKKAGEPAAAAAAAE